MRNVFKLGLHRMAFRLTMRDQVGASGKIIFDILFHNQIPDT